MLKSILILCFLFVCLYYFSGNAQIKEEYPQEVIEFFNEVEKYYSFYDDSLGWTKNFTFEEIKDLANKYYKVIYHYYADYYLYFLKIYDEYQVEVKTNKKVINRIPGVRLKSIRDKISEYFSIPFSELLQVPYLLRIKVLNFGWSYHERVEGNIQVRYMIVRIEDIIKGIEYFKINDSLRIMISGAWFHGAREDQDFKIDSTYFLPIKLINIRNKNDFEYAVNMLPDLNYAIYPIINETVQTPGDYFGIGKETNWEKFKNFIKTNYVIQ